MNYPFILQGDLEEVHKEKDNKCVFLTVHDVGSNHKEWEHLIGHESFEDIKKRAIFVHVDIAGQEDDAEDLPSDFQFPTMQNLGKYIRITLFEKSNFCPKIQF